MFHLIRHFPAPRVSVQCANGYWQMVPQPFPTCLVAACCCSSWCLLCLSPAMTSARTCCPRRPPTLLLHHPPPSPRPSPLLPVRGDTCGATITSKETCARGSSTLTTSTFSRSRRTARSAAPRRRIAPSVSTALPPRCRAAAARSPPRAPRRRQPPAPPRPSPLAGEGRGRWRLGGEGARGRGRVGSSGTPLPASPYLRISPVTFVLQMASPSTVCFFAWQKSKLERLVRMWRGVGREGGRGTLSPESENHYPLSLKCLDENAILKQCIDFPRAHRRSSPRAAQELSPPRSLLPEPGTGEIFFFWHPPPGGDFAWVLLSAVEGGCPAGAGGRRWGDAGACRVPGVRPAAAGLQRRYTATRSIVNIWGWLRTDLTRISLSYLFIIFFKRNYFKVKAIWLFPWL